MIEISLNKLEKKLQIAYIWAHRFELPDWRRPIFISPKGEISIGKWTIHENFSDKIELPIKITTWDVNDSYGVEVEEPTEEEIHNCMTEFMYRELKYLTKKINDNNNFKLVL
jgi:hypothetical protein